MARKKISLVIGSPVIVIFSLVCILVYILEHTLSQNISNTYLAVGGNASSETPFNRTSLFSYVTIFIHVFGHTEWSALALNIMCMLLLGPQIEQSFGKGILLLMFCITAFITGVLSTLFVNSHIVGAQEIVLLLFILSILAHAKTKEVPVTISIACMLYVLAVFYNSSLTSLSAKIIPFFGAFCASVFGFIDFIEHTKPVQRKKKTAPQP